MKERWGEALSAAIVLLWAQCWLKQGVSFTGRQLMWESAKDTKENHDMSKMYSKLCIHLQLSWRSTKSVQEFPGTI